jgi:hypothetical protein
LRTPSNCANQGEVVTNRRPGWSRELLLGHTDPRAGVYQPVSNRDGEIVGERSRHVRHISQERGPVVWRRLDTEAVVSFEAWRTRAALTTTLLNLFLSV